MKTAAVTLLLSVFLFSCGNKNSLPSGIIKPEKMQNVFWDIIRADAMAAEINRKDSSKNAAEENVKLQKLIFTIHNISKEDYYKSYQYYQKHTVLMRTLLDSMLAKANRERNDIKIVKPPVIQAQ